MTGIVQQRNHKMLAVFCMPDHAHLFVGMKPTQSVSDLTRDVKAASSGLINERQWAGKQFQWQNGFGAFSYSVDAIDTVVKYILNQEAHHKDQRFQQEYLELLKEFEIDYDAQYLFDWIE
jgi:putative transposase